MPAPDLPDGLHALLCGAGNPLPDINRSEPCVAVPAGDYLYVMHAGANVTRNLDRFFVDAGRILHVTFYRPGAPTSGQRR